MELDEGQELAALRYDCALEALPAELGAAFVRLECDAEAQAFLRGAGAAPHGKLATAAYRVLRRVLSDYDAYGLLGMYPMHLLGTAQFARLLGRGAGACPVEQRHGALLDVGAGQGGVTARAAPLFDSVCATEASAVLRRKLRARGYRVLDHDLARAPWPGPERFDAVLCLNVLDRCSHPRSLLRHARGLLVDGGILLVSVPLPLCPHVQVGGRTVDPEEPLPAAAESFEAGAASVAREVLAPAGLRVARLSRAPYLCRGDARAPLHVLDAALFACEAA